MDIIFLAVGTVSLIAIISRFALREYASLRRPVRARAH
jgi:hypothetical protein